MEIAYQIWETVRPHIALVGLLLTWFGIVYFALRQRWDWANKRFTNQVNFSLNYIDQGELSLRTLLETTASKVWLNEYGVKLVTAASSRTRPDQPFIILQNEEDMNFVKRAILNVLSEHFSEGFLAHVIGVPVKQATFVFALTFENYADMRARKFRVLIMEAKSLQETFGATVPELGVDEVRHRDRIGVLKLMAKLAASPGTTVEGVDVLGHVELGIVYPNREAPMQIGKVVGHATSTVKHPTLNGWRLLIVQLLTPDEKPDGEPVLSIDTMGAAVGAKVLLTTDAVLIREYVKAKDSPLRFSVMGLVDE